MPDRPPIDRPPRPLTVVVNRRSVYTPEMLRYAGEHGISVEQLPGAVAAAIRDTSSFTDAAKRLGVTRQTLVSWRKRLNVRVTRQQ